MFLSSSAVGDIVGFPGPSCCQGLCCVADLSPTRGLNYMMPSVLLIRFRLEYIRRLVYCIYAVVSLHNSGHVLCFGVAAHLASMLLQLFLLLFNWKVSVVAYLPSAVVVPSDNVFSSVSGVSAVVGILTVRQHPFI
jgi:hypothetical protein